MMMMSPQRFEKPYKALKIYEPCEGWKSIKIALEKSRSWKNTLKIAVKSLQAHDFAIGNWLPKN